MDYLIYFISTIVPYISFFSLFFLLSSIGNHKPKGYKRGIVKSLFAWLLMTLAIVLFFRDVVAIINNAPYLVGKHLDKSYYLSIFFWGLYLFYCGPMYSKIWKRIIKTILYIFLTLFFMITCFSSPHPFTLFSASLFFIFWGILLAINLKSKPKTTVDESN